MKARTGTERRLDLPRSVPSRWKVRQAGLGGIAVARDEVLMAAGSFGCRRRRAKLFLLGVAPKAAHTHEWPDFAADDVNPSGVFLSSAKSRAISSAPASSGFASEAAGQVRVCGSRQCDGAEGMTTCFRCRHRTDGVRLGRPARSNFVLAIEGHGPSRNRGPTGRSGDHRQPRFYASCCAARTQGGVAYSNHRLRVALGMGVAVRTRARHARLR